MKPLEQMNIMDDFLTGSLIGHKKYGEAASRYILLIADNPETHGIRMVYTVKNCCVEAPDMQYDDGNRTIFLYTGGTEGHPTEQLRQLLHYMENSVAENACTKELMELHKMVEAVKQDGEVGLAYMKSFEIEEKIRREGEERGREEGIHGMIRTCRRFKQTDAQIVQLLQEELNLTREQAEDALAKYTQASDEKVTQ